VTSTTSRISDGDLVAVVIPVRTATTYLEETISFLRKQSYKKYELIVVTDEEEKIETARVIASKKPGPAYKRNLGVKKARGKILAFLDDDSYPQKDWLKNAIRVFEEDKDIVAVCGPSLTPPNDSIRQKASGWVWASWFGSAGAGTYRNKVSHRREVDDFPSVNLLVRKKDFERVGRFDIKHWPGEDTKLCLGLTKGLGKKIIYDPKVIVYHHRRPIFGPHLKQISRYAVRRGFFAKKYPETSRRLGYFAPTIFISGLVIGSIISLFYPFFENIYFTALVIYTGLLLISGAEVLIKEKDLYLSWLVMIAIFFTHVCYGIYFPYGFFRKDLGIVPHEIDKQRKRYVGG